MLSKIGLDQLIFTPVMNAVFYAVIRTLEGECAHRNREGPWRSSFFQTWRRPARGDREHPGGQVRSYPQGRVDAVASGTLRQL